MTQLKLLNPNNYVTQFVALLDWVSLMSWCLLGSKFWAKMIGLSYFNWLTSTCNVWCYLIIGVSQFNKLSNLIFVRTKMLFWIPGYSNGFDPKTKMLWNLLFVMIMTVTLLNRFRLRSLLTWCLLELKFWD